MISRTRIFIAINVFALAALITGCSDRSTNSLTGPSPASSTQGSAQPASETLANSGQSKETSDQNGNQTKTKLPVPTNINITIERGTVTISWDAVTHAVQYQVVCSGASAVSDKRPALPPVTLTDVSDGRYSVKIRALVDPGNEEYLDSPFSEIKLFTVGNPAVDTTPPTLSAAFNPIAPNGNGWYNSDVTVHFDALDPESGIAFVSPDQSISTEGKDQPISGSSKNNTGLSSSLTVLVSIDKTAPVLTVTSDRKANQYGWYNAPVTLISSASDALSGLSSPASAFQTFSAEGASQKATFSATDKAGNTGSGTVTVSIDKTAPIVSTSQMPAANAKGWNNSDVVVRFAASDALSGVAVQPADRLVQMEGASQPVSASASDRADNTAVASRTLNIDKTPPTVSLVVTGAQQYNGMQYVILGGSASITGSVSDALSGLAEGSVSVNGTSRWAVANDYRITWTPTSTGLYTFQARATDNADNFSRTNEVTVKAAYRFGGWRPPVSLTGKIHKSGSTLPVKFLVVDANGKPVIAGLNVRVAVGSVSGMAVLDDPSIGQWKAELVLAGSGTQMVTVDGNITPAALAISVR